MSDEANHAFDFSNFLSAKASWPTPAALETYPCRDGSHLECRHYAATSETESETQLAPGESHILIVHGSSSDSRYLACLAMQLADSGYHVHTPDLRGHGSAPARRGDIDHSLQLEEDLEDLIKSLALPSSASIYLAGHSAGGGLTLRSSVAILERHPTANQLAGVILLAPYLHHMATNNRRESTWASPKIARMLLCSLLDKLNIHRLDNLVVLKFNIPEQYRDSNTTAAYSWRMMTGLNPKDYQRDLKILFEHNIPLLALIGEHDEAFIAERLGDCLSPHHHSAQIEILSDIDHLGIATAHITGTHICNWLAER